MSKQPFISIPLDIPDLRVLQTDLTQANEFILTVESTLDSTIWSQNPPLYCICHVDFPSNFAAFSTSAPTSERVSRPYNRPDSV